jgi:hypothetical protein
MLFKPHLKNMSKMHLQQQQHRRIKLNLENADNYLGTDILAFRIP